MATENELPGQGIPRIVFPIMGYTSTGPATMSNISSSAPSLSGGHPGQLIAQSVPSHAGPMISPGPYANQTEPGVSPGHRGAPFGPFTAPVMSQPYQYTSISGLYANPSQPNVSPFQPNTSSVKPIALAHPPPAHQGANSSQTNASSSQQVPVTNTPPVNTSLPGNSTHPPSTNTVSSSHMGTSSHSGRNTPGASSSSDQPENSCPQSTCTSTPPVTSGPPFSNSLSSSSTAPSVSGAHPKSKPKAAGTSSLPSSLPSLDEFTVTKPTNERQNFTNDVARQLFDEEYKKFSGIGEFKAYVSEQQRWRWDIHNNVSTLETRVKNLMSNPNSGVAQNVTRYKTIPTNAKSEDVKRCEATVVTMDAMVNRVATSRTELLHRKGNLLSKNVNAEPCSNEFKFLENCFSRVDLLYTTLITTRACVNQTLAHLRQNFSQESAAAAEVRRLKRRRKENLRKKRKRKEQTLEKRACEILLKITQNGVLERVWSNPEGQRVSANELLHNQLDALKSVNDVEALQLIISRGYLDPSAVDVVSRKMILLQNGVK
ncbi:uncharacterized protein LOC110990335 [Acanthaster planci]|uniref:Uncharacterized protein LOC110990335 n=1 Tax=Acanthaster planci TaxID=133434 RepID=A0A8B7ZZW8_ACAPL|nr:uncharacterized protein LOC110990335 [Acanthaster planci]